MEHKRLKEETEIIELDKRIIAQIIHNIILATYQLRLYDNENNIFLQTIDTVVGFMEILTKKYGKVTLGEVEGKLVLNGTLFTPHKEEIAWTNNFVNLMKNNEVKSIDFTPGVNIEGIKVLLKSMSKKRGIKTIISELSSIPSCNIVVNASVYAALDAQDVVLEKGAQLIEERGEKVEDILDTIEKAAQAAVNSTDLAEKEKSKNRIIGRLLSIDIHSLIRLIEKQLPLEVEKIIEESLAGLPIEKIKEITENLVNQYVFLKDKQKSGCGNVTEEEISRFKDVFMRYTLWLKNQSVMFDLYEIVMRKGTEELLPPWFQPKKGKIEMGDLSLAITELIKKDSISLLDEENIISINNIIVQLGTMGESNLVKQLINKINTNFESKDKSIRVKTANMISKNFNTLFNSGNRELTRFISEKIKDIIDKETDTEVYNKLSGCIREEINQDILEGDYDNASKLIGIFKKHQLENNKLQENILNNLISEENISLLIEDLTNERTNIRDKAFEIVVKLKENFLKHIVKAIANAEDIRKRSLLTNILKRLEEKGALEFTNFINAEISIIELLNMLEVMDSFGNSPVIIQKLNQLAEHYDYRVRKEVIKVITRINTTECRKILLKMIKDKHPVVRLEAVKSVGELKYEEATDVLKEIIRPKLKFIKDEEENLQIESCIALGKLNNENNLSLFKQIIFPLPWTKVKSERIRGSAIQAIGNMKTEEVKKILIKVSKDKNKFIREIAQESLKTYMNK